MMLISTLNVNYLHSNASNVNGFIKQYQAPDVAKYLQLTRKFPAQYVVKQVERFYEFKRYLHLVPQRHSI